VTDVLSRGREAYRRQEWTEAFSQLRAADEQAPLAPEDLELLASAAQLTGQDWDSAEYWTRAYRARTQHGAVEPAARCAFWLAFVLLGAGETARGNGWLARAGRLLDEHGVDCVVRGYLLVPRALQQVGAQELGSALDLAVRALEIGNRFGDPDLVALAQHVKGRVLIRQDKITDALVLLDELMVAVTAGELSTRVVGTVYCGVIDACQEIYDLHRATEWTTAFTRWCDTQPDTLRYSGVCLIHRSEIMQLHGMWPEAVEAAQIASERFRRLQRAGHPALGSARYQLAELHRIRGEFAEAEEAYREASRIGHPAQPGLALLRLAQGKRDIANAAIRRAIDEAAEPSTRPRLLSGYIEIVLAGGDIEAARVAADELTRLAEAANAPILHAMAAHAGGMLLLAAGETRAAAATLRKAWTAWHELDAPHEMAKVRVLLGQVCRELGDEDSAHMELDAARCVFEQLGAAPELARLSELATAPQATGGLTAREIEVLRLVATGKTNRSIAESLFLSEKTVARHVSNILTKLSVPTRAAATAYAYEHNLV
jgi:ATP/maltotriose-dependent transcriptional regulator MalT